MEEASGQAYAQLDGPMHWAVAQALRRLGLTYRAWGYGGPKERRKGNRGKRKRRRREKRRGRGDHVQKPELAYNAGRNARGVAMGAGLQCGG